MDGWPHDPLMHRALCDSSRGWSCGAFQSSVKSTVCISMVGVGHNAPMDALLTSSRATRELLEYFQEDNGWPILWTYMHLHLMDGLT
mmetsp:Transcript_16924/g.23226  ORF Transcript_16924/g.23226 Transcript_16924/m.23226 type:complete len:87 (-) Transcript_16924:194-454(-)